MNRTATIVADTIVACLRANGLLVIRASNAQMVDPESFARDVAANAAMALQSLQEDKSDD